MGSAGNVVSCSSVRLAGLEDEQIAEFARSGSAGSYKAIRDYRAGRLTRFRSFAKMCVTRQIITAVKAAGGYKHSPLRAYVPLDGSASGEDGPQDRLELVADPGAPDPERIVLERGTFQLVRAAAREDPSGLEQRVLRGYLQGKTYQEISKDLRRPPKAIDNALQRAKGKAGRRLCESN